MVDFITEVEEELRKDKYNELLRKYGPYIVALVVILVAVAGFSEFRKYRTGVEARATSASYVGAAELAAAGNLQAAIEKFTALSAVAPEGYSGLSLTRAAALKVRLGDLDSAVTLYDKSAATFTLERHKHLASLKAAYILMDQGRYDDVRTRTTALSKNDAPYRDLARELAAVAALETGDVASARTQLAYLANAPGVLPNVKARAGQSLALLNAVRPASGPQDGSVDQTLQDIPQPGSASPEDTNSGDGP